MGIPATQSRFLFCSTFSAKMIILKVVLVIRFVKFKILYQGDRFTTSWRMCPVPLGLGGQLAIPI